MYAILFGVVVLVSSIPAWIYLYGKAGSKILTPEALWNILQGLVSNPSMVFTFIGSVLTFAMLSPVVGLISLAVGVFNRPRGVVVINLPKAARKMRRKPKDEDYADGAEEDEDDEDEDDEDEFERAAAGKPPREDAEDGDAEKRPGMFGRLRAKFARKTPEAGFKAPAVADHRAIREIRPGAEDEETFKEKATGFLSGLKDRVKGRFSKDDDEDGTDAVEFIQDGGRLRAGAEIIPAPRHEEDSRDLADRLMEWYGAWANLPRAERSQTLVDEAVRMSKEINDDSRNPVIAKYGMRGFSAINAALTASVQPGGLDSPPRPAAAAAAAAKPGLGSLYDEHEREKVPPAPSRAEASFSMEEDGFEDEAEHHAASRSAEEERNPFDSGFGGYAKAKPSAPPDDKDDEEWGAPAGKTDLDDEDPFSEKPSASTGDGFDSGFGRPARQDAHGGGIEDDGFEDDGFEDQAALAANPGGREAGAFHDEGFGGGSGGPVEIEDDIGLRVAEDLDTPDKIYWQDQGARRILDSVYRDDFAEPAAEASAHSAPLLRADPEDPFAAEADPFAARPAVSSVLTVPSGDEGDEGVDEQGDERSSTLIDNEVMDGKIAGMDKSRMLAILGEQPGSAKWLARRLADFGLSGLTEKHPFVPTLWEQLVRVVEYQTKSFAWTSLGEAPPPDLATPEQREEFLVRMVTSIVTFRDQLPRATIEEIAAIKKGTEEIAWLVGRADLILRALSSPGNRAKLRSLVRSGADGSEGKERAFLNKLTGKSVSGMDVPLDDVVFSEGPYEDAWRVFAPVAEEYKRVCTGDEIETFRTLQIAFRPEGAEEPAYGFADTVVGNLRIRIARRLGPMEAGAIGIIFVHVPKGQWIVRESPDVPADSLEKDRYVLVGDGDNVGQALRVRDKNLAIFVKWLNGRQLRAHPVLHFIMDEGAVVRGLQANLGPYEIRTAPWTEAEWAKVVVERVLPPPGSGEGDSGVETAG